jgi:peptidoglycan/LPS O-acetylase OafA/YrhL
MASEISKNLDMLRSVAVLTVMVDHLVPTLIFHKIDVDMSVSRFTAHIGQAGVLAFFVHTSLVLMYSLERLSAVYPGYTRLAVNFYIRRFFRIYPLAIFVIVLVLVCNIPAITWGGVPQINSRVVVCNLLLVQNVCTGQSVLGPLWSLPYEVQMYLLLPALFLLARSRSGFSLLIMLIILFCGIGYAVAVLAGGRMNFFAYFPCFISGVAAYAVGLRKNRLLPYWAWPLLMLLLFSIYALSNDGFERPVYWVGWAFCIVLGVSMNSFRDSEFKLLNSVSAWIAKYSYGMYLFHVPVLYFLYDVMKFDNSTYSVPMYFVLTMISSVFVFRIIEKPFVDIGKRHNFDPAWSLSMKR